MCRLAQGLERVHQLLARAEGQAQLLELRFAQYLQGLEIDFVLGEDAGKAFQAKR